MISRRLVAAALFLVGLLCLFQAAPDVGVLKGFHPPEIVRSAKALARGSSPLIPSFAIAQGITQTQFLDDFLTIGSIDVNNTQAPGFNWYLMNFPSWMGQTAAQLGWSPAASNSYSVANSRFNRLTGSGGNAGAAFSTANYVNSTTLMPSPSGFLSGAKPFYVEANILFNGDNVSTIWMQDQTSILRSINNGGAGANFAEIAMMDTEPAGQTNQHLYYWTSGSASVGVLDYNNLSWTTSQFTTWGALMVPMAYNGGTGFLQFYKNRVVNGAPATWTGGDTYGVEASNYMIMMGASFDFSVDYVAAWVHP